MFWHIHVDTFLTAVLMGLVIVSRSGWDPQGHRRRAGQVAGLRRDLPGVRRPPGQDTYHGKSKLVTPIAITIFFWILLMNLLKMIPADFIAAAGMGGRALLEAGPDR